MHTREATLAVAWKWLEEELRRKSRVELSRQEMVVTPGRGVATSLEEMDEFQWCSVQETDSPGHGECAPEKEELRAEVGLP